MTRSTQLKQLLKRAKIAEPMFNPRLYADEEFIASPDAWWPEAGVAGEVDSRAYHLSPQDHEHTRDAQIAAYGITGSSAFERTGTGVS